MSVGWQELILIFLILLLLFGSRMPEIGRSLGKGIKSFKDGLMGVTPPDELSAPPLAATPQKPPETVTKQTAQPAAEETEDRAG